MEEKNRYYEEAAKWWVDHIWCPNSGVIFWVEEGKTEKEIISDFRERLTKKIHSEVERRGMLVLSTAYSENGILESIAQDAGIDMIGLPWNTTMWIRKNYIEVQIGRNEVLQRIFEI